MEKFLDIDEENVVVCDIDDSDILDSLKNKFVSTDNQFLHDDAECSDEEPKLVTLEEVNISLNNIFELYNVLKDDIDVPKNILSNIFNIQNYLFKKKGKLISTGSLDVWFKKRSK